jgi:hypothetical protein
LLILVFLSALLLLSSCTGGPPAGPYFATRDSAGVVIAENQGPFSEGTGGWGISQEAVMEIGALEGDDAYLFDLIAGGARLSDGSIAVLDSRAPNLRIYDASGEHLRTFGTRGEGPGEFASPRRLGVLPGDTLVVADVRLRRISLFHPVGGFIRSATLPPEFPGYLLTVGMFSSGSFLVQRMIFGEDRTDGYARGQVHYRSVTLDGELETDFGEFLGEEVVLATEAQGERTLSFMGNSPFAKGAQVAVGGERFYYSSQDAYEIEVRSQEGELQRIIRVDRCPQPVTQEQVDALMEEALEGLEDDNISRRFRRYYETAPIPEYHPAHESLFADREGFLWVQETRVTDEEPRRYSIFDPHGRLTGTLVFPNRLSILEIGPDYLLGRGTDDLGVQYIRMYRLTRP